MKVGEIEILPVIDGSARIEPTEAFTGTTDEDWAPHRGLLDENGMLELALGGFLIRSGDRVAIVAVGVGQHSPLPLLSGGEFLQSLASHGVAPEEVTDVIFSHLHFDHIGWASLDGCRLPERHPSLRRSRLGVFVDPPADLPTYPFDSHQSAGPLVAPGSGRPPPGAGGAAHRHVGRRLHTPPGRRLRLTPGGTPGMAR